MHDDAHPALSESEVSGSATDRRCRLLWRMGVALVLLIGAVVLSHRITAPFTGWHEWNSAWYSYFARNHLRYGLGYTAGLCTHGDTADPPPEPQRYLNHPPLIAIWVAMPMVLFGDHPWACRLVPIVSTLGSAFLIMVMTRRLLPPDPPWAGPLLGELCGLFFFLLPVVAYFGRMIDHVPVVQFFSLLMLHGYLGWTGRYQTGPPGPGRGVAMYVIGCLCGIGTGWAAAIMAGLLGLWHAVGVFRRGRGWATLLILVAVPALTLAAVVAHILWALNWDTSSLVPLFVTRTFGRRPEMPQPLLEWLGILGGYWRMNFTLLGAAAVAFYALASLVFSALPAGTSPVRRMFQSGPLRTAFLLTALQGVIYVVAFKNQSWIHEYWQFFLAPFVAYCLACVPWVVFAVLSRIHVAVAAPIALMFVILPLPSYGEGYRDSFWANWRAYHERRHIPDEYVAAFELLNDPTSGIEPFAPVMTFRNWAPYEDHFGAYVHRYTQPQIAYHGRRPLIHEQRLSAILANDVGAAAYILEMNVPQVHRPLVERLAAELKRRFQTASVGGQLVVFLQRPRTDQEPSLVP